MNLLGVLSCYFTNDRVENLSVRITLRTSCAEVTSVYVTLRTDCDEVTSVHVTLRTDCAEVTSVHVTLEFPVSKSGLCKLF